MADKEPETVTKTEEEVTETPEEETTTTTTENAGEEGVEGKDKEEKKDGDKKRQRYQREKIDVTLETVIPDLPKKHEKIAKPDKKRAEKESGSFDEEIKKVEAKIDEINREIFAARSGLKDKSAGNKSLIDEKSGLLKKRSEIKSVRDVSKKESDELRSQGDLLTRENDTLRKKIKYFSLEETNKKVLEVKEKLESEQMPLQAEKRMVQELRQLEASLPYLEQYFTRQEKVNKLRADQKEIRTVVESQRKEMESLTIRITEIDQILDAYREMRTKEKDTEIIPGSNAKKTDLRTQIGALRKKKGEVWSSFRENTDKYYQQKRQIEQIEYMQRQKERLVKKAEWEQRKAEEDKANVPDVPYADEIETCQSLIDYCISLKPSTGKVQAAPVDTKKTDATLSVQFDGMQAMTSKNDQNNDYFAVGGKKKGKKTKKGGQSNKANQVLNHDLEVSKSFTSLKLFVPGTTDQLDDAIKVLKESLVDFKARSEKELASADDKKKKKGTEGGDDAAASSEDKTDNAEESKSSDSKPKKEKKVVKAKPVNLDTANVEEWPTF